MEAHLEPGQSIVLPDAEERAVYVADGGLSVNGASIPEHSMAVFSDEKGIRLEAATGSRIAVIGGARLGRRHIEWNFVSSRRSRIESAKEDWKAGRFPQVPGDAEEFIPLPD